MNEQREAGSVSPPARPGGGPRPPASQRRRKPAQRLVLLGASNLTRGISSVVATALAQAGGPLEIFTAMGHGRSYGLRSRLICRSLPSIRDCGLWDALRGRPPLPTCALLTDIGNDIMYGVDNATIAEWVSCCLDRLAEARVAMTLLPLSSVELLKPWRYTLFRNLLFSGRDITFNDVLNRARDLNDRLRRMAEQRGLAVLEPQRAWYGLDPIHIRLWKWSVAWPAILALLGDTGVPVAVRPAPLRWLRLRSGRPQCWWICGRQCGTRQPGARLADGTRVYMY